MTIRSRVTLWYSAVLLVSFLLAASGMYYELVYERVLSQRRHQPEDPVQEEVGEVLAYYIFPALALTVLGGWLLLRRSLAPLAQLTRAAERLRAENLRESLPRSFNGDEVDRLSEVLNATNQRLSAAMNEIHEFTMHASHELKTPLTILHSEIETALAKWQLSPRQRERLGSQLDEVHRLTRIVEALGLLARSNSGEMRFARDTVPFHEIVCDAAEDAVVLARSRLTVELQTVDKAWVLGDCDRLRQMLLNLVENASKYNQPEGKITIAVRATPATVTFEIANTGEGIRSEDLPNVFKKFYRGNVNQDAGGAGLGLSIAQTIARAHRGEIAIDNSRPGWTLVRVHLPRVFPALKNENGASKMGLGSRAGLVSTG